MKASRCLDLLIGGCLIVMAAGPALAQESAATMPIADLHFHPERNRKPAEFDAVFERSGVRWFGLGERLGGPQVMRDYKTYFGRRYIMFGGQSWMNSIWERGGPREVENPDYAEFKQLVSYLDQALATGRMVGIGELFVNNRSSPAPRGRKMNIFGPVIRTLFEVAAKHDAFVAFHLESDSDSIAQLEELAASNARGRIILNHCGMTLTASFIDRLFTAHPNLYCELSSRYAPTTPGFLPSYALIFTSDSILYGWKDVIVKHADRFMIGTDVEGDDGRYVKAIQNVRTGLLANLPIEVARQVAYANAVHLFHLD